MENRPLIVSVLGSGGGVAKAVLSLLNKAAADPTDPLHPFLNRAEIHLIDRKPKKLDEYGRIAPNLKGRFVLHQFDLLELDRVRAHLADTGTSLVIDLSWADTVDMIALCDELGIAYTNTALEIVEVDDNEELEGFTLLERYRMFENNRHRFTRVKGIVCSGMNPGVVQWMAHTLLSEPSDRPPLACYIVETDSTFFKDPKRAKPNTIYSSWSPECFLDEALLNYPMLVQRRVPLVLYAPAYGQAFKVTLGDLQFYGALMPHEEVLTLGRLYGLETGFIYKVQDYMIDLLRANLDQPNALWDWEHRTLDPAEDELEGEDTVGVLVVYEDKERYMYNTLETRTIYAKYGVNATYFQVACGVYGAICTLLLDDLETGLFFVDELLAATDSSYGEYVSRYLERFVTGENAGTDGLLLQRLKPF
ncbi:saccharopine dehydrogenase NADP-binding domain-containing protein [Paenibacillus flagellatus]|uniref:S-adenosylmethionine decarboxylase related protein n=1 Tax=Paenibacillus flagellatus TaxID=2211139 RepID=A0A2V5K3Q8_9BACL|nr:saccharopine dehydrogenase NADP-binding domain-containing protein [Paenibacillus flagellatus]PYI52484.1 S-adenosylmethionine decarboxylase related protein [Paenibacillus flagellatus]